MSNRMATTANSVTTRRRRSTATRSSSRRSTRGTTQDENQQHDKRTTNTVACVPIIFGSIAFYLGKKADEFQTHQWTLFVRGPNHEDLSHCIAKVVFQLHASFSQPTREVTDPPYEVTERGWGEFEAQIRIIWKDATERPTVVNHGIKLYPPGAPRNALPSGDNIQPVVSESYDEVVFTDPHESFFRQLQQLRTAPKLEMANREHLEKFSDEDVFLALVEAQKYLKEQLSQTKDRFVQVSSELEQTDMELHAAQEAFVKKQQAAAVKAKARAPAKRSRPSQSKKAKTAAAAAGATAASAKATTSAASSKAKTGAKTAASTAATKAAPTTKTS